MSTTTIIMLAALGLVGIAIVLFWQKVKFAFNSLIEFITFKTRRKP